ANSLRNDGPDPQGEVDVAHARRIAALNHRLPDPRALLRGEVHAGTALLGALAATLLHAALAFALTRSLPALAFALTLALLALASLTLLTLTLAAGAFARLTLALALAGRPLARLALLLALTRGAFARLALLLALTGGGAFAGFTLLLSLF